MGIASWVDVATKEGKLPSAESCCGRKGPICVHMSHGDMGMLSCKGQSTKPMCYCRGGGRSRGYFWGWGVGRTIQYVVMWS